MSGDGAEAEPMRQVVVTIILFLSAKLSILFSPCHLTFYFNFGTQDTTWGKKRHAAKSSSRPWKRVTKLNLYICLLFYVNSQTRVIVSK